MTKAIVLQFGLRRSCLCTQMLHLLRSPLGTKRARAYATDVRSWWKLTCER